MGFVSAYLLFLAKAVTAIVSIALLVAVVLGLVSRNKRGKSSEDELEIQFLNEELQDDKIALEYELLEKADKKALKKNPIKPSKDRPRLFVIDFDGDIDASETEGLRRQITAIIQSAKPDKDQVLLRLESPGGVVHGYGLAASQLDRIKQAHIPLTISVDKVAASGGYMMACVADNIIAAPFAILGSIGVIAQMPNINRLLEKNNVDIELHTAGKYKRTLTTMGKNTDEGREKFKEELELTHNLFKQHINTHRPQIDIETVATGETWYGQQAIDNNLADKIQTSDDFILQAVKDMDIYHLSIEHKKGLIEKIKEQFMFKNKAQINHKYFM